MLFQAFLITIVFGLRNTWAGSPEETTCIAAVDDGLVVGSNQLSENGKRICKYLALPYALPPIGNLRFEVCFIVYLRNGALIFFPK